jgi:serine/threonine protein phosphatase PrpC
MLDDREIGTILWETEEPESACRLLIDRANDAGGRDNIKAIAVDVVEPRSRRVRRGQRVIVRRKVGCSLVTPHYDKSGEKTSFRSI